MNNLSFSFKNRKAFLKSLHTESFDLVIIGGGITGAGIALDAAVRGLKTALIEKNDFASGTSSRSTKLIHGGLRYLKQLQFHVVAETGRERSIVHRLAPHLVVPEKMMLPIFRGEAMGKWMVSMGLWIYDRLAGVRGDDRKKMLDKQKTLEIEPLLTGDRLTGSGYYAEYMTDDARLTIEVVKTAVKHGATCLNYVEGKAFHYDDQGLINGIRCKDKFAGDEFLLTGKYVVNASGPWVDDLREKDHSLTKKHLFITKGIHLVFDRKTIPLHNPLYYEIPDGRMIFLIPRFGKTYIGTTDTPYTGDKENIPVTEEDVDYLLDAFHRLFPAMSLEKKNISSAWAGIRPLIYEEGKSASEISRKDEIFISSQGLISMAGGKLTGYRKMAEKVVNLILKKMKKNKLFRRKSFSTIYTPLTDNPFSGIREVKSFNEEMNKKFNKSGIREKEVSDLVFKYGRQTTGILDRFTGYKEPDPEKKLLLAELDFSLENEMIYEPLDFLERRSSRLFFNIETVKKYYMDVLERFKGLFNWDEERFQKEKLTVEKRLEQASLERLK